MPYAIKAAISLLSSKDGRKLLSKLVLICLTPVLLAFLLITGGGAAASKHNNQLIETIFFDKPIPASVPYEYRLFIENYKYAFTQIDDAVSKNGASSLDHYYLKTVIFVAYIDKKENQELKTINYTSYIYCFTQNNNGTSAITDKDTVFKNVSAFLKIEFTSEKKEMVQDIYAQLVDYSSTPTDVYTPMFNLLADKIAKSEDTKYVGGDFGSPFADGWKQAVTSEFGWRPLPTDSSKQDFHTGIDIGKPMGTTILSVNDGTVVLTQNNTIGLGLYLVVDHGGGIFTVYGHTSRILVKEGAVVKKGQPIAEIGSTGYSTGPHIHFEVIEHSKNVNPRKYLK